VRVRVRVMVVEIERKIGQAGAGTRSASREAVNKEYLTGKEYISDW